MKTMLTVAAATFAFAVSGAAYAQADLLKANGCMNCHDISAKKVGPAFKDIAAKFKGKADAEKMLVAQLKDGKGHPAVKASEARHHVDGQVRPGAVTLRRSARQAARRTRPALRAAAFRSRPPLRGRCLPNFRQSASAP